MKINRNGQRKGKFKREIVSTLGVCCWNLIGQEGNISRVAAGLTVVYKAAQNHKAKSLRIREGRK